MIPTVIELVGLPGVGKSTITKQATQSLTNHYAVSTPTYSHENTSAVYRIPTKLSFGLSSSILHPTTTHKLLNVIHESNQQTLADMTKTSFNITYVLGLLANARQSNHDIVLFDQGFYQALWSIAYSAQTRLDITNTADLLPPQLRPDIVYVITASEQEIQRRVTQREKTDTRYDPNSRQADRGTQLMSSLQEYLTDECPSIQTRVLQNETRADLSHIIQQLEADII